MASHGQGNLAFVDLPAEILVKIVGYLVKQADINNVTRLNKQVHNLFNDFLYQYNVQHFRGDALLHAAWRDHEHIARKLLDFGADINLRIIAHAIRYGDLNPFQSCIFIPPYTCNPFESRTSPTPLSLAARHGSSAVVRLLLETGANTELDRGTSMPFYAALEGGHEEIALEIASRMPDLHRSIFDDRHLTSLHAAVRWASPLCTRYLLENGANVDELEHTGNSALSRILDCPSSTSDPPKNAKKGKGFSIRPDKVLEIVKTLLEFGADPDLQILIGPRPRRKSTPRAIAEQHKDERIRILFRPRSETTTPTATATRSDLNVPA